jgi:hypothetical protein
VSCPQEPIPPGWRVWRNAAVPTELAQFAIDVRDHVTSYPYGSIAKTMQYGTQTVGAFVSHHTWTWRGGQLVTGICIPGVSLIVRGNGVNASMVQDSLDTPDPTAAVYGADIAAPSTTSWPVVLLTGGIVAGLVGAFILAVRSAGRVA